MWKAPPGELASLPNLKLITNLGAGVDPILADETIPPHIPVARLGDEVMAQMMAQFVTMCVLRHYRDLGYSTVKIKIGGASLSEVARRTAQLVEQRGWLP